MEIVLENVDCCNLWILVGTNLDREGFRSCSGFCWSSARRHPRSCGLVKSFNWCDNVSIMRDVSARGVLVLVTRGSRCDTLACMFSGEGLFWNIFGIFEFMWGQIHVQGFLFVVRPRACWFLWVCQV